MVIPFRIKICGITTEAGARAAIDAGADHLGLLLCPSPRRLALDRARRLVEAAPASWVGVFADSSIEEIVGAASELELSAVQLHGSETAAECRAARLAAGVPVWKAVRRIDRGYEGAADVLLLDSGRGGTGRTLDWNALGARLSRERPGVPIVLAGGLSPDNVAEAVAVVRPDGVDASSRLERAPGVKDPELVRAFVRRARRASEVSGPVEAAR